MEILFLLNGLVALLISILLARGFLKNYNQEHVNKVTNWFSVAFFVYALLLILYGAWFFGFFEFNAEDYSLIYSIAIIVQTLVFLRVVYSFTRNKKLFYFLLFYFILFLVVSTFSFQQVLLFSLIISFLLTLILSFNFVGTSGVCKRVGYIGVFYSCASLILGFLLFFNIGDLVLFSFVSNSVFLVFAFFFLKDVEKYPLRFVEEIPSKGESHVILFIKYFVYIIVLTNFVLISTVGVHELSHVLSARYYGCESRAIAFESGTYPYSEIVCDDLSGKVPIALAGPLVPIVIALILFIIGGRFIRPTAFLIVGFNLLASYRDFEEVGLGQSLLLSSTIAGLILLFAGISLLAVSRMHESHHHKV